MSAAIPVPTGENEAGGTKPPGGGGREAPHSEVCGHPPFVPADAIGCAPMGGS